MNAKLKHYIMGESSTLKLLDSSNFNMFSIESKNKETTKMLGSDTELWVAKELQMNRS